MKVHLIKANDFDSAGYTGLMTLLQSFPGPLQFKTSETLLLDEFGDALVYGSRKEEFTQNKFPTYNMVNESLAYPRTVKTLTWRQLFDACNKYRRKNNIADVDHVILLTSTANESNWFGAADEHANNYFIHTVHWSDFFGSGVDDKYPLAYEVVSWVLRRQMFSSARQGHESYHAEPRGCMMDFCKNKLEIILKMRTGDICSSCMNRIKERDVSRTLLTQIFQFYDEVSRFLKWRERAAFMHQPGRIEFRGAMQKIYLTDFGGLEIKLNPMQRALYILFMRHHEGIELTSIQDHRAELERLYSTFSNAGDIRKMQDSMQRLCDPSCDAINIQLSRIRRAFREALGEEMALHYSIERSHNPGDFRFKISLNREWVEGLH